MKNLILIIICGYSFISLAQKENNEKDECEFFEFLKGIDQDKNNENDLYSEFNQRRHLIKKLESYIVIFDGFNIAPVLLDSNQKDPYAQHLIGCDYFQKEYREKLKTLEKHKARGSVQNDHSINIKRFFFELLDLDKSNNNDVLKYITELKYPYTVELVFKEINSSYFNPSQDSIDYNELPKLTREENLITLSKRLDYLDNTTYSYYQSYNSKPRIIKGFEMYHDNDVFMVSKLNQDRELTGGFKFTVITDHFKWRWLPLLQILGISSDENLMTYQSISLGGVGYTPYIRYRNNFELADTLHKLDRPFASYAYIERAKHRIWRKGLIRHTGEFQVGFLGISQGRKIQAKLHEDVIHSSQFVHGWDNQIADGGRLAIQANHKLDLLLCSSNNRYATIFRPNTVRVKDYSKNYISSNLSTELDLKIGTIETSLGAGLRFSTLNFLQQSGHSMIMSRTKKGNNFGFNFDFGISYRYVVHNAMLEGIGFLEPFPYDEYDKVDPDNHVLASEEVERNLFSIDFGINLKFRKTTVFFRQVYHTLEYKSRLSNANLSDPYFSGLMVEGEDDNFYNNDVLKDQNSFLNTTIFGKTFYGFGRLGISWIIE